MTVAAEVSDAVTSFDRGRKSHEPQIVGGTQKLEKAWKHSLLELPEGL